MHRKTIRRDDWTRILEKDVIIRDFEWKGIPGKISLLNIKKVSSPLSIDYETGSVKIVDEGYSWVQIALEKQYFWITSMFDEQNRLVEIYVDMTDGNVTDADDPYFSDLYLDYVVHIREDAVIELDRGELDAAYQRGSITPEQYERTLREGRKMFQYLRESRQELEGLLIREQKLLKEAIYNERDRGNQQQTQLPGKI